MTKISLKWIATYKDNTELVTDYSQNYNTQKRFRHIKKSELKKFTWIIRGVEFSLDCISGEFCIDGEIIKPDCAVKDCGIGLVAFIRGYRDLGVGSGSFRGGIESVNLGYKISNKQVLLKVDFQTLKWEIHKSNGVTIA